MEVKTNSGNLFSDPLGKILGSFFGTSQQVWSLEFLPSALLSPPPKAITFFNFLKITFCKVDTHIDMFLQFLFPRTQFSSSETTAIIRFFHSHLCLCVYVRILNRNGNALYSSALCYFQSKSWRSFPISALFFRDIVVFCGIEFLLWLLV